MGKLLERLQASVRYGEITDVLEEWKCKHGEIGIYGARENDSRVFIAAIRNGHKVVASKYSHLEIQGVMLTIRNIASVCGAEQVKPSVIQPKAEAHPPEKALTPRIEEIP